MKLKLTNQQNEIFETIASNVNFKYYYFDKVYVKLGNNEFEEKDFSDLPQGIQKYINEQKEKK